MENIWDFLYHIYAQIKIYKKHNIYTLMTIIAMMVCSLVYGVVHYGMFYIQFRLIIRLIQMKKKRRIIRYLLKVYNILYLVLNVDRIFRKI